MAGRTAAVIVGPTAAGKSDAAMLLAGIMDGEIVSADSMQVYKGMDIGTAKPTEDDRKLVRHHLLDICEPDDPMTVSRYCELAKSAYDDIVLRGKMPIIVGGTGLYVDAATMGFLFPDAGTDEQLRGILYKRTEDEGPEKLHAELTEIDPDAADRIHPNDAKRIVRALEVFIRTGKPISELQRKNVDQSGIPARYFGIAMPREVLVRKIDARVDKMMQAGLLEEVIRLVESGFAESKVAMQAIGYKELVAHIEGRATIESAVEKIKLETRKYAKRQMTWFRRYKKIKWYNSNELDAGQIAEDIAVELRKQV